MGSNPVESPEFFRFMRHLLKLSSKCEDHIFIRFQTPHFISHFFDTLSVGDAIISPVLYARNLEAYFDSNMTLVPFINNGCKSAFSQLYNIRKIRKYLTTNTSKTLVHAMITSRIDYCNSLLCGLPDNCLNKLQRVQNAAARLITGTAKLSHITPMLRSLHWLPIKQRVQFKMLILVFKAINGLSPILVILLH